MSLTDAAVKATKPTERPRKLFDGGGLYLLLGPDGSRGWRFKYRYAGKERLISFGTYPGVTLKEARDRRDDAKRQLRDGIDPSAARKAEKQARVDREQGSFELVAREWHAKQAANWVPSSSERVLRRLVLYVFPKIGGRPIRSITGPELLEVLRAIEARKIVETAHRVKQYLGQIFRYAMATHRADADPTVILRGALAPAPERSYASITDPKKIGELLRAIRGYTGSDVTRLALQLMPLLFVRPGELRAARWDEFTFDLVDPIVEAQAQDDERRPLPEWRIPAGRMKMGEQHLVPLSRQAVAILRELHKYTGPDGYVFPGARSKSRYMSENTINAALRRLDYGSEEMTGHGFRHMASTILHERGYRTEWIERQLAHGDRNSIRARYNFAEHLPERRRMMQEWADYLDTLVASTDTSRVR